MATEYKNEPKPTTTIIVDDERELVDIFSEYLELKNIRVLGRCYNGKDAVELYKKFRPDVVFLDVIMPDYTGFYALEKIKQINPDANVIIVTADLAEETENKLVELHASYILYKPIELDNLKIIGATKE